MQATPPTDWATREDFALLDGAPAFSVGSGAQAVTFWQSMVASTPELAARSAEDCERRWAELKPADDTAARVGPQPAVLEEWSRMADGRISGRIAGQSSAVWLTVALEGRLASDPRVDEPGYIEAVGGRIYELGAASLAAAPSASAAPPADAAPAASPLSAAAASPVAVALGVLLAGAAGFGAGMSTAPPPPPPPAPRVTRVFISQAGSKAEQTSQQLQQLAGTPPKSPASLTVKEQRERAELRVDRDKKKLEMMQQRIREDEQTLSELKRVEGERGGESDAVRLVFPTPDGPRM